MDTLNGLWQQALGGNAAALSSPNVRNEIMFTIVVVAILLALLTIGSIIFMPKQRKVVRKRLVRRVKRSTPQVAATAAPAESSSAPSAEKPAAKRPRPRANPVLVSTVLWGLVVVVAFVATYYYTGTTNYCAGSCHNKDAHVLLAVQHPHAACVQCHETDPFTGAYQRAAMAISQGTGLRVGRGTTADPDACLRCHASITSGTVTTRSGLIVSHKEILAGGRDCRDCHPGAGHGKASAVVTMASMTSCSACHDGKVASRACETCHKGGSPLTVATAATKDSSSYNYATIRVANRNCFRCHGAEQECIACHGLQLPHPKAFIDGGHAREAAFDGKQKCMKCHTLAECGNDKCHHSFSAHNPQIWRTGHQKGTSEQCGYCHLSWNNARGDFCKVCH